MNQPMVYSDNLLDAKRLSGDPQADEFIRQVFANDYQKRQLQQWMQSESNDGDLQWLQSAFPGFAFIEEAGRLPLWAQPRLLKAGAAFFAKHSENIMSLLGLLSLPYCYSAANGAMVLHLSELIRKQTTKRLYDTAVFVWEVMGPDAFDKNGNAYNTILKIRLMHAAVRYYTFQSGKWEQPWGLPINQEDMAGTNIAFSLIVIRGLRMLGINVNQQEQAAYMHTWAVIGYFMGLDDDLIPHHSKTAYLLDTKIKERQFCASDHGRQLTQSLVDHILSVNKSKASANDILGLMQYLLGDEISETLAIKAPKLPAYKLALIKTVNVLKSFKPGSDSRAAYQSAYHAFKKQSTGIVK